VLTEEAEPADSYRRAHRWGDGNAVSGIDLSDRDIPNVIDTMEFEL
jgi:hypothetical protein